ncbi:MAG: hypothetical protein M3N24_09045 [Actinomycetota bacterium]|nr:hypothetical protein [Actinomycetota bacterium]
MQPRTEIRIRIFKRQRPRDVRIEAWKRVDRHGMVVGDVEELPYKRRKVRLSDGAAWDFTFTALDARRHYYVSVTGVWRDEEGSGELQDASWGFHVRTSR